MSLKAFHIVFIVLSFLLASFCAVWFGYEYKFNHDAMYLVAAILLVGADVGLFFYGKAVLRKLKHISYL